MMAIMHGSRAVIILDQSLQQVRRIPAPCALGWICFSEARLFATTIGGARIISYSTDSFEETARYQEEELDYDGFADLVLASNGLVYAVGYYHPEVLDQEGVAEAIVAFDPVTLQRRLHFGRGVFSKEIYGLAFVGDELYAGDRRGRSIRAFSLAGANLREIKGDWREPCQLLHHSSRLYLVEQEGDDENWHDADEGEDEEDPQTWSKNRKAAGKRILVLTPEGETLQVWKAKRTIFHMCLFGRKLIAKVRPPGGGELIALKGI